MKTAVTSAAGIALYASIPATSLREFVDGAAPYFAKCSMADVPPFGNGHRFFRGHDLLLDVAGTFKEHGVVGGVHHG